MTILRTLAFPAAVAVVVGIGCLGDTTGLPGDNGNPSSNPPTGTGTVSGDIPCDVAAVISQYCTSCHGSPPTQGAPDALTTLAGWKAASVSQPTKTVGQVAVERMANTAAPMPPKPSASVPSSGQATVAAWVSSGMPAGTCGTPPPDSGVIVPGGGNDGGTGHPDAGPSDAGVSGDLPCNIASILTAKCTSCHGSPPTNSAPTSLNSLSTLRAYSPIQPSMTEGQLAVQRMANTAAPMPPLPAAPVSASNQATFSTWVSAGMPGGTCGAPAPDAGPGGGSDGGSDGGTGHPDAGPSDAGVSGDLPCDVANLLSGYCTLCHGSPPAGGAPDSLDSLATLHAASVTQPTLTRGQVSVQRMASTTAPMPPAGYAAPPATSITSFDNWVDAGMPAGTCSAPTPDAGPPPDPIFSGPPTCTSGTYWTQGNQGSSQMHPGWACINCHRNGDGPNFAIAGTVYPTGHEYDDCYGSAASGAVVVVTDSAGTSRSFTANSAGNFSGSDPTGVFPTFPITATVNFKGKVRAMATPVNSGDCNTCHTEAGINAAPGRIALP
jgi:hypothetical protein